MYRKPLHKLVIASFVVGLSLSASAADYTLLATPTTVAWGYYSGFSKPVLTIKSGDTVKMQTLASCGDEKALARDGVAEADIPKYIAPIHEQVTDKGPGGHILTGPVFVEGAEVGDVLEVQVVKIDLDTPFACNHFRATSGFLQSEFPYAKSKIIPLDREKMVANFGPGIVIPLHPFFGSMGVAPGQARVSSGPPAVQGGNMDNKELVAGSSIFYPVLSKGGLFEAGDGHAGQGNGEVDVTAMETFLSGTFRFIVHKDQHLTYPRAETPANYISMGFSPDLKEAATLALHNMIAFLIDTKHMNRDDAYMLTSVACDMDVTEVVDGNDGVHVMCPKSIFIGEK
jgi:acetamidase/formamidase